MAFFNEKKNQKDSDDFWHRKLTSKVKFWYFLTAPHYSNFQNLVISFEYSWFLAKSHFNFVSLPWKLHNRECHNTYSLLSSNCTQLLLCIKCAKRLLLLKKVGEPLCVEMGFTRIFLWNAKIEVKVDAIVIMFWYF